MALSFLFGGDTGETPETLKRKRELAMAIMGAQGAPKNVGEGLTALGAGITAGIMNRRADKAESTGKDSASALFNRIIGRQSGATSPAPSVTPAGGQGSVAGTPGAVTTSGDIYSPFMDTVKTGITNPYGLAAVASTANAESRFSPKNANRAWSDPSESGKAGTAGGIMSWRDDRLNNMYAFAGQKGEKQGAISPTTQAEFFLQENPQLIAALNNAKSVEEAQALMNEAWKFAGWNRPGGEAANRMASANAYLSNFQGQPQREVASLDPSIGMPNTAGGAVTAMGQGGSLSDEVADYEKTPEYAARFPGRAAPSVTGQPLSQEAFDQRFGATQATPEIQGGPFMPPSLNPAAQEQPAPVQVAQAQPTPQPASSSVDPALYELLTNPWASPEMKAIAQAEIERQSAASDPLRQLQMEEQRLKLDAMRNPKPDYDIISGKDGSIFRADKRAGTVEQVYGGKQDLPTDVQEYEYARNQGYQGTFAQFQQEQKRAGATNVNIDQKAEGAFDKKLAEKQAEAFDTMAAEGLNARADLGVIGELDGLLQGQGGTLSGLAGIAAKYGIGGEGIDDLQAAQALINKLVPTQRAPGSGSMSDRDVELFTRSLPSLWNAPGGNQKILSVMRGLAQYKQAQGEIADMVINNEISRQEGRRKLRELPNPLEGFKMPSASGEAGKGARRTSSGVQWSYDE